MAVCQQEVLVTLTTRSALECAQAISFVTESAGQSVLNGIGPHPNFSVSEVVQGYQVICPKCYCTGRTETHRANKGRHSTESSVRLG